MFVFALFLIGASVCESCSSKHTEATCSDGCKWTNGTGSCSGSSCVGTANCEALGYEGNCYSAECTWHPATESSCSGNPTCIAQNNQITCNALGCSWGVAASDTCRGAPTECSGDSASCRLDGCYYRSNAAASCSGRWDLEQTATCSGSVNQASCKSLSYCQWNKPTGKCVLFLPEDLTCEDFDETDVYGGVAAVLCSEIPGCEYSGKLGSCSGTITKTCDDLNDVDCDAVGCGWDYEGQCVSFRTCADFNNEGEKCGAITGCSYSGTTCSGTPTNCNGKKYNECNYDDGCQFVHAFNCVAPTSCSLLFGSTSCTNAGCAWDSSKYQCTGTSITVTDATCNSHSANANNCEGAGCIQEFISHCAGSIPLENCADLGFGGTTCVNLGCSSSGTVNGVCRGEVAFSAGAGATSPSDCGSLGDYYYWQATEGKCVEKEGVGSYSPRKCKEFTDDGKERCAGLGCYWKAAVSEGCVGTPTNGGTFNCTNFNYEEPCESSKCEWVAADAVNKICTGTPASTCSAYPGEGECKLVAGCTYTPKVISPYCSGQTKDLCIGDISHVCYNIGGCSWSSEECVSKTSQSACEGIGACVWDQPGTCADAAAASVIYVPALLVFLILTLLL